MYIKKKRNKERNKPGRPPLDNGERRAKSICFCESSRTINDGILTTCFRTLKTSSFI
jgi:hypothetical protein